MTVALDHSSHAVLVREKRIAKARKIAAILSMHGVPFVGKRLLDVGTGGGFIAEHFMRLGSFVTAVDRDNQLPPGSAVDLRIATDVLPFDSGSFDIVISNHVIEHVGPNAHEAHLREVARVVRPGGVVYVATPNRWTIGLEPHFKLPLISWPPRSLRPKWYDVWPLSRGELVRRSRSAGLTPIDVTGEAMRLMGAELPSPIGRLVARAPLWLGSLPVIPSLVFLLKR